MNRKWDITDETIKKQCIEEVIARVEEIEGEQVGMIAAQDIIDIVVSNFAPEVYNKALFDVQVMLQQRLGDIEVDIDLMRSKA